MHLQTVLGGLVVIWGDEQHSVCAVFFSLLGEHDSSGRVVGTGAGNDRHAMVHILDGVGDDLGMFFLGEGGRFASGAADDDGIGAIIDLEIQQTFESRIVNGTIRSKWGNDCAACASENRHKFFLLRLCAGRAAGTGGIKEKATFLWGNVAGDPVHFAQTGTMSIAPHPKMTVMCLFDTCPARRRQPDVPLRRASLLPAVGVR